MAEKKAEPKTKHPLYLAITPVEQLIDEGIVFEGQTDKDRMMNMVDFTRLRDITQRYSRELTGDQNETLIRSIKSCIANAEDFA